MSEDIKKQLDEIQPLTRESRKQKAKQLQVQQERLMSY